MQFRVVPLLSNGHRYLDPIDLFLHDPSGLEIARWTARNAVSGPIHVQYVLASETPIGTWRLSARTRTSRSQPRSLRIQVAKYRPVGFEVQLWMPSSLVPMDNGLHGWIKAKRIGDEAPIFGSLRIEATLRTRNQGMFIVI